MGGDLNLKKSWNPVLLKNQERVWIEQKKALEERKRIDQMMKERAEERQIQELQELQEAAGGTKRLNRVDWMYSGPAAGQAGTTEEMEGYLLGKRRIDGLIKGNETEALSKSSDSSSFMAIQNANTLRDTASKVREDPLLAIKKQEQAAYEVIMNNSLRRRELLKAAGVETGERQSSDKDRKHRRHHRRDDEGRHSSRRSRRHDEDRGSDRHRVPRPRSRDASPSRRPRRSPSPYRKRRSHSPRPRDRDRDWDRDRNRNRDGGRNRSRSPYKARDDHHRYSRYSPDAQRRNYDRNPQKSTNDDNRAARLAAMQQNAEELDRDRTSRLTAAEQRDKAEREVDDAARAKASKYGGKGAFVNALNRRAGDIDLADRLRRGRRNVEKEQEAY
ncbi:RNA-splicing factor [Ophidiomyces ophidiicola]|uniref:RNA-splicing factor n=1 Tax=Ophidiomyces ophidiicola TaxID=1387563 RepID=A0ACB8UMC0_9EURO|nr:RNA-splicing factor [Ophidiomyces ophidiicola]KAI1932329.1 RNA-splicing factor [Ophidiomyces ophidiicola]KAI1947756.1 RNA-splicing factor [Ophidiomyces ophidiicola]KAI2032209.1 RNA-splicing factor [Ophidiomyces ophidiicola]KAI2040201.1 RNA-splicing factor [Ophidiomyces ophidiicola]